MACSNSSDLAVGNRAKDNAALGMDVIHLQDAGASVGGIGDPARGLGGKWLQVLLTVDLNESSSVLGGVAQEASLVARRAVADPEVGCSDLVMVRLPTGCAEFTVAV